MPSIKIKPKRQTTTHVDQDASKGGNLIPHQRPPIQFCGSRALICFESTYDYVDVTFETLPIDIVTENGMVTVVAEAPSFVGIFAIGSLGLIDSLIPYRFGKSVGVSGRLFPFELIGSILGKLTSSSLLANPWLRLFISATIRLILTPSLTNGLPLQAPWCKHTTSHWSLKTGEPDEPGSVSVS
jgi:hypothetical protein